MTNDDTVARLTKERNEARAEADTLRAEIYSLRFIADETPTEEGAWWTPGQLWHHLVEAGQPKRWSRLESLIYACQQAESEHRRADDAESERDALAAKLARVSEDIGPFGDLSAKATDAIEGMFDLLRAQAHSVAAEVCNVIHAALADPAAEDATAHTLDWPCGGRVKCPACCAAERPNARTLRSSDTPAATEDVRKPADWAATLGFTIHDPDGWRNDRKDFDEPVTAVEFDRRAQFCTISFHDKATWHHRLPLAVDLVGGAL